MDLDTSRSARQFRVQMNLAGEGYEEKLAQTERLLLELSRRDGGVSFTSKQDQAQEFYAMYGGFLFLGIFLGLLFLLATVLIIYYKQISEGYEDQRRYLILRQVGMSQKEVDASIQSQILLVFFLPLGAAALHVFMAFPMLSRMLELFNLYNVGLFALCTAGTLAMFCLLSTVPVLAAAWLFSRFYQQVLTGLRSHGRRTDYRLTRLKGTGRRRALLRKEASRFFGTPIYLFNTGFGLVILIIGGIAAAVFLRPSAAATFAERLEKSRRSGIRNCGQTQMDQDPGACIG